MSARIVVLGGDGIGPEVIAAARRVLDAVGLDADYDEHSFGGAAIDAFGTPLHDDTLAACRAADAVLLGAVGGPRWDRAVAADHAAPRPEAGLLGLRQGLGLYANLRPVRPLPALEDACPLRRERIEGTDLLVVRELTGGIYFGDEAAYGRRRRDVCDLLGRRSSASRASRSRRRARRRHTSRRSTSRTSSRRRGCGASR